MKNSILIAIVGAILVAILLLMTYPPKWLVGPEGLFADAQAIVVLFAMIASALALSLLIYPVLDYLRTGQKRRIEVIKGFYSPRLVIEYFRQFWMGRDGIADLVRRADLGVVDDGEIHARFDQLMERDFGMGRYRFLLSILLAVGGIVMFFAFAGGFALASRFTGQTGITPPLGITVDLVSIAAIFGAYIWVTSDAIARNHYGAFQASDLSWYALRLVIAVPLGQAISMAAGTGAAAGTNAAAGADALGSRWAALLAFVISMFSLDRIKRILASIANRSLQLQAVSPAEREDLVIRLPGVDERTSDLLGAEGVTTISQAVAADPVRLSIRTALAFDYVLGLIDAGILWTYVGNQLATFREFGIKGASSVLAYRDGIADDARLDAIVAQRAQALAALAAAEDTNGSAQAALATAAGRQAAVESTKKEADAVGTQMTPEQTGELEAVQKASAATEAAAALEKAREAVGQADAALRAAVIDKQQLLQGIADKAQMSVSGIEVIFAQIEEDAYARFIRRLM
jgi:LysM repeat protein